jgi:NMD protein affecting ribosome stability and mRNA decay
MPAEYIETVAEVKKIIICPNCGDTIDRCAGCNFSFMDGDLIYHRTGRRLRMHYCRACKTAYEKEDIEREKPDGAGDA